MNFHGVNYTSYPFTIANGACQQIIPENQNRVGLIIVFGNAQLFVRFKPGPLNQIIQAVPNDALPLPLKYKSIGSVFYEYQFYHAPTGPVTLYNNTLAISGTVYEGVPA